MGEATTGTGIRLTVNGPDFDTGDLRPVVIEIAAVAGDAAAALTHHGLTVIEDGNTLILDEPFPGTPFFETLSLEYDFYGDLPVEIILAEIKNNRPPKELFFIPALMLLAGIVLIQRRRAKQPPF